MSGSVSGPGCNSPGLLGGQRATAARRPIKRANRVRRERRWSIAGVTRPGTGSLHPVAIGAAVGARVAKATALESLGHEYPVGTKTISEVISGELVEERVTAILSGFFAAL
jgi:hypothetical protein